MSRVYKRNEKTGYYGVNARPNRNGFVAYVKNKYIGAFPDADSAARARDAHIKKLYSKNKPPLNFPEDK